jgi:hypothetical protein
MGITYFCICCWVCKSEHNSVSVATGDGLDDWMIGFRFLAGAENFSLRHRVQTSTGAHPASYSIGTGVSPPGVKRPGREADHLPPSRAEVKECVNLYLHSPGISSWRGAYLSTKTTLSLPLASMRRIWSVTAVSYNLVSRDLTSVGNIFPLQFSYIMFAEAYISHFVTIL